MTQAPRSILNRQIDRLAEHGLVPYVGTELEFMVFDDGFRDAWAAGYRGLTPATDYNVDYAMHASTRMEPLLRDIRLGMDGAGMYCEGVKGECNFGQQEIAFRYDHARVTCDNHTIYKNGAKEIADKHGKSLTFMAKFDEREGEQLPHPHLAARRRRRRGVRRRGRRPRDVADVPQLHRRPAGHAARADPVLRAEHQLLQAFRRGQLRADRDRVGDGQPHVRCAWSGTARYARMECRAPGGDVNQYLASALIAGGLYGIERELELPEALEGNAYTSGAERLPTTLAEAAALFGKSEVARRRSATTSSSTTQQRARRARRVQRRGDRLGKGARF